MRYLLILFLLLSACALNVRYQHHVRQVGYNSYYLEIRQPGYRNVQALRIALHREAEWYCDSGMTFHTSAWVRQAQVWYAWETDETVGGVTFSCHGSWSR